MENSSQVIDRDGTEAVCIDRNQEDSDVLEFQKTGDIRILERVYKNRIPTIRGWAHKHYYPGLTFSVEDLFEDLSEVFVKAAEKYDASRGTAFNTCLWIFMENRLKNIKSSQHAQKRLPEEYKGSASSMILSFDHSYNNSDGAEVTLKDVISSQSPTETDFVLTNTYMEETLNVLSKNNSKMRDFLKKVSEGSSLVSLMREYKTQRGKINLSSEQLKRFGNRKCTKMVAELLKTNNVADGGDFKLLGYTIEGTGDLQYEIELKKTEDTDMILKALRDLKKNKDLYKKKLAYMK